MRKGKVYPSSPPPPPTSSSSSPYKDPNSVLKLLPVTILALALSLPKPDLEVLAYLISTSITTNPHHKTKCGAIPSKKNSKNAQIVAKVPLFECCCFECYTSFWFRWDSSPKRELIHDVIEAFEEHLMLNESSKEQKSRRRAKVTISSCEVDVVVKSEKVKEIEVVIVSESESGNAEENVGLLSEEEKKTVVEMEDESGDRSVDGGLARKVLPEVVGLFSSSLWSLWNMGS